MHVHDSIVHVHARLTRGGGGHVRMCMLTRGGGGQLRCHPTARARFLQSRPPWYCHGAVWTVWIRARDPLGYDQGVEVNGVK